MGRFFTIGISALLLIILCTVLNIVAPWWTIIIPCMLLPFALPNENRGSIFCICFTSLFILWSGMAFYINMVNEGVLANRITPIFYLPKVYSQLLPLMSGLVGGLVGGLGGVASFQIKRILAQS